MIKKKDLKNKYVLFKYIFEQKYILNTLDKKDFIFFYCLIASRKEAVFWGKKYVLLAAYSTSISPQNQCKLTMDHDSRLITIRPGQR